MSGESVEIRRLKRRVPSEPRYDQAQIQDVVYVFGTDAYKKARVRQRELLEYIKEKFHPDKIFYPGSGMDQLPRDVFGKEHCTYSSLTESPNYFEKDPPDIIADYRENPFPDEIFDLVYIHDPPLTWYTQAQSELIRVLKIDGMIVFASTGYSLEIQEEIIKALTARGDLREITPDNFKQAEFISSSSMGHHVNGKVFQFARKSGISSFHSGQRLAVFKKVPPQKSF